VLGEAVSEPLQKDVFKALLVLASQLLSLLDNAIWDIKADRLNHQKISRTLAFYFSESWGFPGNSSVRSSFGGAHALAANPYPPIVLRQQRY